MGSSLKDISSTPSFSLVQGLTKKKHHTGMSEFYSFFSPFSVIQTSIIAGASIIFKTLHVPHCVITCMPTNFGSWKLKQWIHPTICNVNLFSNLVHSHVSQGFYCILKIKYMRARALSVFPNIKGFCKEVGKES